MQPSPLIGHRGLARLAPENTMAGFAKVVEHGIAWVEFDVHLTRDNQLAVIHDARLGRTTTGTGLVGETDSQVLSTLDAGSWFGPQYTGERLPDLAQVLAYCSSQSLGVNIEVKPEPHRRVALCEALAATVATSGYAGAGSPLLFSSFDADILAELQALMPGVHRALARDMPVWRTRSLMARLKKLDCKALHIHRARISKSLIRAVKAEQLWLGVFTVNDQARADRLWAQGVDYIFSDLPLKPLTAAPQSPFAGAA